MSDEQLHKTFNLEQPKDSEENESSVFPYDDIPEHLTLDDIAHMATYAYREQVKDAQNIPTKNRPRAMEVAKNYLDLAKDAVHKRDDHEIKKRAKQINTVGNQNDSTEGVEDQSKDKTTDRRDVYSMIEEETQDD